MRIFALLHALFLFGTVLAESAVDFCDRKVVSRLEEMGLHLGNDAESGDFVVIAHSQTRCADPALNVSVLPFCRDVFLKAYVKARREIANGIRGTVVASNAVEKVLANGIRSRAQTASITTSADDIPLGMTMLTVEGAWRDGVYAVSIAMGWNERRESQTRDSRVGLIVPSEDWRGQMRQFFSGMKVEFLPPFGEFTDSNGFVHLFGAEVDDVLSRPLISRSAAIAAMEVRTTANLHLIHSGAGVADFGTLISTRSHGGEGTTSKTAAGDMVVVASNSTLRRSCVFEGNIMSETFNRPLYALVYADDSQGRSRLRRESVRQLEEPQTGVQIWNPNTGKYEKQ